jgi:hypothetical protein
MYAKPSRRDRETSNWWSKYAGVTPAPAGKSVWFLERIEEDGTLDIEQYPIIVFVLRHRIDEEGKVTDTEIVPGFYEHTEWNQVAVSDDWTAYLAGDAVEIGIYRTGEEPSPADIEAARQRVMYRRSLREKKAGNA